MSAPNNPYPTLPRGIDPAIVQRIRQGSQASAADFGLLVAQAAQESGFRPEAKAASGSATGLFQFVDSTWLDMMRRFGAKYGQGDLARTIALDAAGRPAVADPATRQRILALRTEPQLSAALAGEYARVNQAEVERALGHPIGRADVYMAHFLGAGGATLFLKALETRGNTVAAALLPEAAASNRAVFYDAETGRPRSVAEIYRTLGGRIEQEARAFGALPPAGPAAASGGDAMAPLTAMPHAPRLDFAGLRLSQPVATMLDALALAALKLAAAPPRRPHSG